MWTFGLFVTLLSVLSLASAKCSTKKLVRYNVTFEALWAERDFPKQYPHFRPPAQWTKVLGRSHDSGYGLFSVGELISPAVKEFVETGVSAQLDQESQGEDGIYDIFYAPAIPKGVGQSVATFFADGRHSKVSMIAKIVPSPDWFVGIDSEELCENNKWKKEAIFDLDPMDGGTDQGYTFSAPNWPQEPPLPVSVVTSKKPNHPANSFFYPDKDRLPFIGRLVFKMISAYEWTEGEIPEEESEDLSGEIEETVEEKQTENAPRINEQAEDEIPNELPAAPPVAAKPKWNRKNGKNRNRNRGRGRGKGRKGEKVVADGVIQSDNPEEYDYEDETEQENGDQPIDCEVSAWTQWSACSKTCGFGTRNRERTILQRPMNYGRRCPNLVEDELCGSMRTCSWKHFDFGNKEGNRRVGGSTFGGFRFGQASKRMSFGSPTNQQ